MSIMRKIPAAALKEAVLAALAEIAFTPDVNLIRAIQNLPDIPPNSMAADMLASIVKNATLAPQKQIPCCQDTGTVVIFINQGINCLLECGDMEQTICEALEEGWKKHYLRRSIVAEPLFERKILRNQVPPVIHWRQVSGDQIKIHIGLKGGGAENMSMVKMMPATSTPEDITQTVVQWVVGAGGKPCPPVVVGVGLGGNFEGCALMAKEALFEPFGRAHPDQRYATLEQEILRRVNEQGRGVMGMGQGPTALAVQIKTAPCHIASLPLGINLNCHAHRHTSFTL